MHESFAALEKRGRKRLIFYFGYLVSVRVNKENGGKCEIRRFSIFLLIFSFSFPFPSSFSSHLCRQGLEVVLGHFEQIRLGIHISLVAWFIRCKKREGKEGNSTTKFSLLFSSPFTHQIQQLLRLKRKLQTLQSKKKGGEGVNIGGNRRSFSLFLCVSPRISGKRERERKQAKNKKLFEGRQREKREREKERGERKRVTE